MLLGFWVRSHHGLLKLFLKRSWFCPICVTVGLCYPTFFGLHEGQVFELEVQWQGFVHFRVMSGFTMLYCPSHALTLTRACGC